MSVLATVICHWSLVIRIEAIGVQRFTIPRSAQPLAASAQIDRYRNFLVSVKNSKLQTCLGHWILKFGIFLKFGA
jgi:hypothetical protein